MNHHVFTSAFIPLCWAWTDQSPVQIWHQRPSVSYQQSSIKQQWPHWPYRPPYPPLPSHTHTHTCTHTALHSAGPECSQTQWRRWDGEISRKLRVRRVCTCTITHVFTPAASSHPYNCFYFRELRPSRHRAAADRSLNKPAEGQ